VALVLLAGLPFGASLKVVRQDADNSTNGLSSSQRGIQQMGIFESDKNELRKGRATCTKCNFNKCTNGDLDTAAISCKTPIVFPMTTNQRKGFTEAEWDEDGRVLTSPYVAGDAELLDSSCQKLLRKGVFKRPEELGSSSFSDEFVEVVNMQYARLDNSKDLSEYFEVPALFHAFSLEDAAQAVKADFPSHWPTELVIQFLGEGAKMNQEIISHLTEGEFVNRHVLLASIVGWAVRTVSPVAFECKWYYGRARPEEVAWRVHSGDDVCDIDDAIKEAVEGFVETYGLEDQKKFSAYPDVGCPTHPSFPAMHSAASSASMFLPVVMDLTREQELEARRLDYAVAASRSLAGVHYHSDNLAGLAIGQEIVAERLGDFLEDVFKLVLRPDQKKSLEKAIKAKQFDWYRWVELGCHQDSSQSSCDF